jgi:autotransporter passenger strand-loop-strand repeat protein
VLSGRQVVSVLNGTISGDAVGSGETEYVLTGGTALSSLVMGGGNEIVSSGGGASAVVVTGGVQSVQSGGAAYGTVVNRGQQVVGFGGVVSGTMLSATGRLFVDGGVADDITVAGGATVNILSGEMSGGVLRGGIVIVSSSGVVSDTVISGGGITLSGGLAIDTEVVGIGAGFSLPSLIFDWSGYQFGTPDFGSATLDSSTDLLTVTGAGDTSVTLQLSGDYTGEYFQTGPEAMYPENGGTFVALASTLPCFAAGTRLAIEAGEIEVEALRVGDRVTLHDGRVAPIVWIGRRHIDCAHHPDPEQVWPVRVAANAFADGLPSRDLLLSPNHAVFADAVLIPVKHLINGTSIAQVAMREVNYFHIELSAHEVLLAEGLPVESWLDTGDRANFENGGAAVALRPNFTTRNWEVLGLAPLVVTGSVLDRVRQRVNARIRDIRSEPPSDTTGMDSIARRARV